MKGRGTEQGDYRLRTSTEGILRRHTNTIARKGHLKLQERGLPLLSGPVGTKQEDQFLPPLCTPSRLVLWLGRKGKTRVTEASATRGRHTHLSSARPQMASDADHTRKAMREQVAEHRCPPGWGKWETVEETELTSLCGQNSAGLQGTDVTCHHRVREKKLGSLRDHSTGT